MTKKSCNSTSGNKLLINKQEMVLIKNSEEAKNTDIYGNLYDALEPYDTLSLSEFNKDIVFDNKAKIVLTNNKELLIHNIEGEWYSKSSYIKATTDVYCQLCGRKNTYVCYIVNRINGKELHVGTECVTHFKTINGVANEIRKFNREQRDQKKEVRRIEFEVKEGNEVDFLKEAENKFKNFPVLLPYKLHQNLKDTLAKCNRVKTTYISSGGDINEVYDKFVKLKLDFNDLYRQALEHYENVKNNPLVCNLDLIKWINNNIPSLQEDIQKNNGILNEETLKYIYEPNFINSKLSVFRSCSGSKDIKIIKVEGNVIRFSIQNNEYIQSITFTTTIKDFMRNIGCYCLTNNNYKFKKQYIPNITIENTTANFRAIDTYISKVLKNTGYKFTIENKTSQAYWEKKQFFTTNRWSRNKNSVKPIYKKTTIEQLFKLISPSLLDEEFTLMKTPSRITRKIDMSGKWITQEEKNRNTRIAAEAAGMQKQKEFIPY